MAAICESARLHRDWARVAVQPFTLARLGDETMPPLSFTTEELAFIGLAERADRMWAAARVPARGRHRGRARRRRERGRPGASHRAPDPEALRFVAAARHEQLEAINYPVSSEPPEKSKLPSAMLICFVLG